MKTALLLIDVQRDVLWGVGAPARQPKIDHYFAQTVQRLCQVKNRANEASIPVIVIQHAGIKGHRLAQGSEGWQIHQALQVGDNDRIISKTTSDSFYQTELLSVLMSMGVTHLVVGGFMSQYCVDLSVRRAVALGFDVTLIEDGHSTCDESGLSFEQIIVHHNNILPVLKLDGHGVALQSADSVTFFK
ncbi:cysteine hydrolase family protein [Acerihabitans sp. TG2]|uniref:cysteine hydrolase family protein n=1 Tax=Acerihabitans sp. TG2 TaxID=3096008 RepID=UPI002B229322|nr:cysteine hydrolase family protein [Acerihabitans sp. TG2]MEA9392361.1 cysteine hydrolase family protein [Acerihabitans sp. TG2]